MEDRELLEQARERAVRVLEDLRRQQVELLTWGEASVAEAGQRAIQRAVDAAARMVESIEEALRGAGHPG